MRSEWVERDYLEHLLAGLSRQNREALRLSLDYGLRIGDVLKMPVEAARKGVYSLREEKTGKRRVVKLSDKHCAELLSYGSRLYCFEGRLDWRKHRTRQAVWKDLKRMSKAFRVPHVTPHSCRKIFSVALMKKYDGDIERVQHVLNHSDPAVTMLYALANEISNAHDKERKTAASRARSSAPRGGGGGGGAKSRRKPKGKKRAP